MFSTMPDASWKAWERRVAKLFPEGRRRGADFRGDDGGKTDVISPGWAIECKLLGRPSFGQLLSAAKQAEDNASDSHDCPVAIVKRKNDKDGNALVVMRLKTWLEWYVS